MRTLLRLSALLLAVASAGWAQDSTWTLVWSDEFNQRFLDSTYWNYDVGTGTNGWGNNELQYYTDGENISFVDSCLVIDLRKQTVGASQYTSSRINTRKKMELEYGKIQARIKAPYSQAVWPAFWTLGANFEAVGWPACGEMDIFEMACGDFYPDNRGDHTNFAVVHWTDEANFPMDTQSAVTIPGRMADDFHIFTLIWDENYLSFYFDTTTTPYLKVDITKPEMGAFHQPHSIVLDLALGGTGFAGSPDASTVLPQQLTVDWVRWYQKKTGIRQMANKPNQQAVNLLEMVRGGLLVDLLAPSKSFLRIYDCRGRLVLDLTRETRCMSPGTHVVSLMHAPVTNGMYIINFGNGVTSAVNRTPITR